MNRRRRRTRAARLVVLAMAAVLALAAAVVVERRRGAEAPQAETWVQQAQPIDRLGDNAGVGAVIAESDTPAGRSRPAPPSTWPPVVTERPQLRVENAAGSVEAGLERIRGVAGVSTAALVVLDDLPLVGGTGPAVVRVAAVDPADFRRLAPQATADAVGVWQRVAEGHAAFTHHAATRLGLPLGAAVPAAEDGVLRVGAYASNGAPPIADAIIARDTAARLGLSGRRDVLVSLVDGADAAQVAGPLAALTGGRILRVEPPRAQPAMLAGAAARRHFEPYRYVDHRDGTITIDPAWVRRNIVRARMPLLHDEVVCHRLMVGQLRGALQEVADRGLGGLIDPGQYGGCWVARHIDWSPSRPLSMHAWGLAIDLNTATNQLGAAPAMDPRIVAVFERWGFAWGGDWDRPDGMHFELGAILAADSADGHTVSSP